MSLFGDDGDDGGFSIKRGSTKGQASGLASLFSQAQALPAGANTSLTYQQPVKQNKKGNSAKEEERSSETQPQPQPQAQAQPPPQAQQAGGEGQRPAVVHAATVTLIAYEGKDRSAVNKGSVGAAILSGVSGHHAQLLTYNAQKQTVAQAPITSVFVFGVSSRVYGQFTDERGRAFSLQFADAKDCESFAMHVALARFLAQPERELIGMSLSPMVQGARPLAIGDAAQIRYSGYLPDPNSPSKVGAMFDSNETGSKAGSSAMKVVLGQHRVVQGWEQGLVGQGKGSRLVLVIPSKLGYGSAGRPPTIPGNSIMIFVLEVLRTKSGSSEESPSMSVNPATVESSESAQEQETSQPVQSAPAFEAAAPPFPGLPAPEVASTVEEDKQAALKARMAKLAMAGRPGMPVVPQAQAQSSDANSSVTEVTRELDVRASLGDGAVRRPRSGSLRQPTVPKEPVIKRDAAAVAADVAIASQQQAMQQPIRQPQVQEQPQTHALQSFQSQPQMQQMQQQHQSVHQPLQQQPFIGMSPQQGFAQHNGASANGAWHGSIPGGFAPSLTQFGQPDQFSNGRPSPSGQFSTQYDVASGVEMANKKLTDLQRRLKKSPLLWDESASTSSDSSSDEPRSGKRSKKKKRRSRRRARDDSDQISSLKTAASVVAAVQRIAAESDRVQRELDQKEALIDSQRKKISTLRAAHDALLEENTRGESDVTEKLRVAAESARAQLSQLLGEKAELGSQLDAARLRITELQRTVQSHNQALEELRGDVDRARDAVTTANSDAARLRAASEEAARQADRATADRVAATDRAERLADELAAAKEEIKQAAEARTELQHALESATASQSAELDKAQAEVMRTAAKVSQALAEQREKLQQEHAGQIQFQAEQHASQRAELERSLRAELEHVRADGAANTDQAEASAKKFEAQLAEIRKQAHDQLLDQQARYEAEIEAVRHAAALTKSGASASDASSNDEAVQERVKGVMNKVYAKIYEQVEEENSYAGQDVLTLVGSVIRATTLKLLNGEESSSEEEEDSEENEEEDEVEVEDEEQEEDEDEGEQSQIHAQASRSNGHESPTTIGSSVQDKPASTAVDQVDKDEDEDEEQKEAEKEDDQSQIYAQAAQSNGHESPATIGSSVQDKLASTAVDQVDEDEDEEEKEAEREDDQSQIHAQAEQSNGHESPTTIGSSVQDKLASTAVDQVDNPLSAADNRVASQGASGAVSEQNTSFAKDLSDNEESSEEHNDEIEPTEDSEEQLVTGLSEVDDNCSSDGREKTIATAQEDANATGDDNNENLSADAEKHVTFADRDLEHSSISDSLQVSNAGQETLQEFADTTQASTLSGDAQSSEDARDSTDTQQASTIATESVSLDENEDGETIASDKEEVEKNLAVVEENTGTPSGKHASEALESEDEQESASDKNLAEAKPNDQHRQDKDVRVSCHSFEEDAPQTADVDVSNDQLVDHSDSDSDGDGDHEASAQKRESGSPATSAGEEETGNAGAAPAVDPMAAAGSSLFDDDVDAFNFGSTPVSKTNRTNTSSLFGDSDDDDDWLSSAKKTSAPAKSTGSSLFDD